MVYADSLSAIAANNFKFSKRAAYHGGVEDFEESFAFLESTPCDILITPHPEASDLWERLRRRSSGAAPDAMISDAKAGGSQCKELAEGAREQLRKRLVSEAAK